MNASVHSLISVKHHKGIESDYYAIHDFMDCSKEIDSSNRHRIYFHTMWGVKQVVIPIFGHTIKNSNNINVNVKDLCEMDHILPDYKNRFIPTLADFIEYVDDDKNDQDYIDTFHAENKQFFDENEKIKELMTSPLFQTGKIKSLLLTHNSWFVGFVLPKIFKNLKIELKDYNISPARLFNRMMYAEWMQNGHDLPSSAAKLYQKQPKAPPNNIILSDIPKDKFSLPTFDGQAMRQGIK